MSRFVQWVLIPLLVGCSVNQKSKVSSTHQKPLKVFLVRHAEKVDNSENPDLSEAGYQRASTLAEVLRSAKIEHVHSSDFLRTKKTALPTAEKFDLKIELYDQNNLMVLSERLKEMGGVHLVVGHSNTTPVLAELLGGDPGEPINEAGEYDRLYLISITKAGNSSSTILRFGNKYDGN
ncbi:MAG TPA: phosphoglycerate mutase family protein [Nitrospirales bacterium]|nr:phosphoglycerate mutase family protein [Nitrospirales bacterium]